MSGVTVSRIGDRVVAVHEADPQTPEAERLLRMAETLRGVSHPCVVELLEVQTEPTVRVATGFVSADSWADHPPQGAESVARFAQLCSVMADLHHSGIVHGSLESRHVLVRSDSRAVVCGFGRSGVAAPDSLAGDLAALADIADELAAAGSGRPSAALQSVSRDLRRGRLSAQSATLRLDRVDQRHEAPRPLVAGSSLRARLAGLPGLRGPAPGAWSRPGTPPDDTGQPSQRTGAAGDEAPQTAPGRRDGGAAARRLGRYEAHEQGVPGPWRRRLRRIGPALAAAAGLVGLAVAVMALAGGGGPGPDGPVVSGGGAGEAPAGPGPAAGAAEEGDATDTPAAEEPSAHAQAVEADAAGPRPADVTSATPEVQHNGRLYAVGRPGDLVLLGDWSCDGTDTPAVLRPSSGEVAIFAGWPADGSALRPEHVEVVQGASSLVADTTADCDRLRVHTPDGSRLLSLDEP